MFKIVDPCAHVQLSCDYAVLDNINRELAVGTHHHVKVGSEFAINGDDGLAGIGINGTVDVDSGKRGRFGDVIKESTDFLSYLIMVLLIVTQSGDDCFI